MLSVGCLRSIRITSLHRYFTPIRHPLIFNPLPVLAVIGSTLLQGVSPWDEEDFSSCLVCPYDHAATTTPPKCSTVPVRFRWNMLLSLYRCELSLRGFHFRGHLCVRFCCGLIIRSYPIGKCVGRLQHLGFPPCCYPSYRVLTPTLVGFIFHGPVINLRL